jgi:TldD protein
MPMRTPSRRELAAAAFLLTLVCRPPGAGAGDTSGGLLPVMKEELDRSLAELRKKGDPPPYFVLYQVKECRKTSLEAANGALRGRGSERHRHLGVQVRVGDWQVDNTHRLRQEGRGDASERTKAAYLPLGDDPAAVRSVLWIETDKAYKKAAERYIKVKTDRAVTVDEADQSADFTEAEAVHSAESFTPPPVDLARWEEALKAASAVFDSYPDILQSDVTLTVNDAVEYLVTSEGTALEQPAASANLVVSARAKAPDGMELDRSESFELHSVAGLPGREALVAAAKSVAEDLVALRKAPVIEPYGGPAILSGRAAAVFFHEVFGHRMEGQRQKDEEEGQTFTKKVGTPVLPDIVSVYDDPTLGQYRGMELNGFYRYDNEGVAARRVTVVEQGVLKSFLLSRSPVAGFAGSNGHGRGSVGNQPVARQGNLIVEASSAVGEAELRARLLEECRRQDKSYGLYFKDIVGGHTYTGRSSAQAYLVSPVLVYRVFVDGRPDELVRGVNLIGTPLLALNAILAFGSDVGVFNGSCGAESGWVSVSAVSPSFLTAKVEVQKQEKSTDPAPLLPPPPQGAR